MLFSQFKSLVLAFLVGVITLGPQARPASGGLVIDAGYDLLFTLDASFDFEGAGGLGLVNFVGRPIHRFDFEPSIANFLPQVLPNTVPQTPVPTGKQLVRRTDTILQRLDGVSFNAFYDPSDVSTLESATIPIEFLALKLRSADAIDWSAFGGVANEYVKASIAEDNGSTMTIRNDFTFDSELKIDLTLTGMTSGAELGVTGLTFEQYGGPWGRTPLSDDVLIPGVNFHLNGANGLHDFFTGIALHGPNHIHRTIDIGAATAVPEPSSLVLFGLGTLGAGFARRRRLRKVNPVC